MGLPQAGDGTAPWEGFSLLGREETGRTKKCPELRKSYLTIFRGAGQQIMAVAIPGSRWKADNLRFRLGFRGRRLFCCPLRREDIVSVYHIVALADLLNGVTMLPPFAPRAAVTGI